MNIEKDEYFKQMGKNQTQTLPFPKRTLSGNVLQDGAGSIKRPGECSHYVKVLLSNVRRGPAPPVQVSLLLLCCQGFLSLAVVGIFFNLLFMNQSESVHFLSCLSCSTTVKVMIYQKMPSNVNVTTDVSLAMLVSCLGNLRGCPSTFQDNVWLLDFLLYHPRECLSFGTFHTHTQKKNVKK